ncbi:hypothetical protein Pmani_001014 [Petrolisthes manimaculis]|uniref:Uncharacterized protein n=1 Tax=Petrolisthes manimaculis TaxID=1843537 RepID=A0AAE1QNK7_9EUCA|nr:hypothetical protein Pmani_001014 [Petrolisthes manimaculis]
MSGCGGDALDSESVTILSSPRMLRISVINSEMNERCRDPRGDQLAPSYFMAVVVFVGFRCFCSECRDTTTKPPLDIDELKKTLTLSRTLTAEIGSVTAAVESVSARLTDLENKSSKQEVSSANVLRENIEKSKSETLKGTTKVIDQGKAKIVRDQQVLVVKPTSETMGG